MNGKASIVVLNWNGKPYLERCLSAALAQSYPDFEVILVDNGSTDGSVQYVSSRFPQVRIVANEENLGFAEGNNVGIRASRGEFIATLNNDTEADRLWLKELVRAMISSPRIGLCASKMLLYDRPKIIDSAGVDMNLAAIAWDRKGGTPDREGSEPVEVFGACAGAALYRRQMLDEVGLFDEEFFIYLEDVDLAWRARMRGWRCLYVPTAKVYHVHSATMVEGSPIKNYLLGRNKVWTIIKDYPMPHLLLYLPIIAFYDLASLQYTLLLKGDTSALRGRIAGLMGLRRFLKKRGAIQGEKSTPFSEIAKLLYPLESPLAMWRRYRYLREKGSQAQRETG